MGMRWLSAGVLVLLGAQDVGGQDVRCGAAVAVGERVRVDIARQYRADNIAVFQVNRKTGSLKFTGHYTPVGNPSIIVFLDLANVDS